MAEPTEEQPNEVWTVRRVLDWTVGHLRAHGSESPRLDAEVLLAHARGCERIQLYTRFEEPLEDDERELMRNLVKRRANHEPVAYLVGFREFYGLHVRVTPDVLVPRPETETLVLEAVERLQGLASPRVLDVCTGSGCVAIAIAHELREATVAAVDLSPEAAAVARENVDHHDLGDRVTVHVGDLLDPAGEGPFDAIVANPPYVTDSEYPELPPDVLHEPRLALVAGADGLDVVRRLVAAAPSRLTDRGLLLIEVDPQQIEPVRSLSREAGLGETTVARDANGAPRVVVARRE